MTTRGPLPAATYWRRRVFVVGVALSLVFVLAQWLRGNSDGASDETVAAEQAAAQVSATETVTAGETPTDDASETAAAAGKQGRAKGKKVAPATPTLAAPEGTCAPSDVAITPSVAAGAEAGGPVTLDLSLQTLTSEACTWRVAPASVVVTISAGKNRLWTSQQCPGVVKEQAVVVRKAVATVVKLTWNARESAASTCGKRSNWVLPGDYTISAAALGGEPASTDFKLVKPADTTVVVTPKAKNTAQPKKKPTEPVN